MRRFSIRFKLVLAMVAILGVLLAGHFAFVAPRMEQLALDTAYRQQEAVSEHIAHGLNHLFEDGRREIEAAAAFPELATMDPPELDRVILRLNSLTQFFNYFFVVDPQGTWVAYPSRPRLVGRTIPEENRGWLDATLQRNDTVFLDVHRSLVDTLVSGFAAPIRRDGAVVGILRGVLVVSQENDVKNYLAAVVTHGSRDAYVTSTDGRIVAHTSVEPGFRDFDAIALTERRPVREALAGRHGVVEYERDGERIIASYRPITPTGWAVVAEQSRTAALRPFVAVLNRVTALFFGAYLVACLLLLLGVQVALRPLANLVRNVEAGRIPETDELPANEIGVLAGGFRRLYLRLLDSQTVLADSEEKLSSLVEQSGDGIAIVDVQGDIVEWNPAMTRITHVAREAAEGKKVWDVLITLVPLVERTDLRLAELEGQTQELIEQLPTLPAHLLEQREILVDDRDTVTVQQTMFSIRTRHGSFLGIITRDITQLVRLQESMRQNEKLAAIGELAGGVAHDFNNQLTGIVGYADLLRMRLEHDDELRTLAEQLLRATRRAGDLTGQLLAFARRGKFLHAVVDVHHIINEVVDILSRSVDKRISIEKVLRAPSPFIRGDPSQIQNALLNLALNARDAMPGGGELRFETDPTTAAELPEGPAADAHEPYLRVRVVDTGCGMDAATAQRMFEPFFTTKLPGEGTGMGLAAVYGTVRGHNGSIDVSSAPGEGTVIEMFFPGAESGPAEVVEAQTSPRPTPPCHVLLIDDEEIVLAVGKRLLETLGHTVICCADSREAVAVFAAEPTSFDVVILDLVMPHLSGREVFERLRAIHPDVRVIVSSGYSVDGEAQNVLDLGAGWFLQKPFRRDQLARSLREALTAT